MFNSGDKQFNQTRPIKYLAHLLSFFQQRLGNEVTYSRAGHSITSKDGVVDVEVDTGVVGRVATGQENTSWDSTSTTGHFELSARDVELSWHRLERVCELLAAIQTKVGGRRREGGG